MRRYDDDRYANRMDNEAQAALAFSARVRSAELRDATGAELKNLTPAQAAKWVLQWIADEHSAVLDTTAKNRVHKLEAALRQERAELLIYWGKVAECVAQLGYPINGKAAKRDAMIEFGEWCK